MKIDVITGGILEQVFEHRDIRRTGRHFNGPQNFATASGIDNWAAATDCCTDHDRTVDARVSPVDVQTREGDFAG